MDKILAVSENYKITHSFETVYLITQKNINLPYSICIGDFYGNPEIAIIDRHEKWCITAGCGLIVYYLNEPFRSYSYNTKNAQYDEYYRDPSDLWWIIDMIQITDTEILLTKEDGQQYLFNLKTKKFTFKKSL